MVLSKEVIALSKLPWFPQVMKELGYEPVKHGRWISVPNKKDRICSKCEGDEPYKFADENVNVFDYCPHCGAKMDEVMEDGET